MNLQEASRRFHISLDKLTLYEKNGLLRSKSDKSDEADYSEAELQRVGIIHTLLKAGFDIENLKRYLALSDDKNSKDEQIKILRKQRGILLSDIHDKQQSLDELDYMIIELRKNKLNEVKL